MVRGAWLVLVLAALPIAFASEDLTSVSSLIQTMRDNDNFSKESVLEVVEQVLAQESGGDGTESGTTEIRRLLQEIEDEILRELREQNPEALVVAWNITVGRVENEIELTQSQIEQLDTQVADYATRLATLRDIKRNKTLELEKLQGRRKKMEEDHTEFREQLQRENTGHLRPSAVMARTVHTQLNAVFDNIPDPFTDVIAPAQPALSLLQVAAQQDPPSTPHADDEGEEAKEEGEEAKEEGEGAKEEGEGAKEEGEEGSGGKKEAMGEEVDNSEVLSVAEEQCNGMLATFNDMVSQSATSPIVGLSVLHGEIAVAVPFSTLEYDVVAHTHMASAIAVVAGRVCEHEVLPDGVNVSPVANLDGFGPDHTLFRFTLIVPHTAVAPLLARLPEKGAEISESLAHELRDASLRVAPELKDLVQRRALDLQSLVLVSASLSAKERKSLLSDPHFCALLDRTIHHNTNGEQSSKRTQVSLGAVLYGTYTPSEASGAARRALQRALDPFHFAVTSQSLEIDSWSPLQWFTQHVGVGVRPISTQPAADLEACALSCIADSVCLVFAWSPQGTCYMGDRGQFLPMDNSVAFSYHPRQGVLPNFDLAGRSANNTALKTCATTCFETSTCIGFLHSAECVLFSDRARASPNAILYKKHQDTRVRVTFEINTDVFTFGTLMERLCFVDTWNRLFALVGESSAHVTSLFSVRTVGQEAQAVCTGRDRLVPEDPLLTDDLQKNLQVPVLGPERGDPTAGQARVRLSVRLPLEFTAATRVEAFGSAARALGDVLSLDPSAIFVSAVTEGSVVLHFTVATTSDAAESVSVLLSQVVTNSTLVSALAQHGLAAAWAQIVHQPTIEYMCVDQFMPMSGRLDCAAHNTTHLATVVVAKPCACAHHAAMHQMTHFSFDPRTNECVAMRADVDLSLLDAWYDRSCVRSVEGDDILFLSGEVMSAYVSLYSWRSGMRPDTAQTGVAAHHRFSEDDTDCCARQCAARDWCKAFVWYHDTQLCDLFSVALPALVPDPSATFYSYTGYDEGRALSQAEAVARLTLLTQALVAQLKDASQFVDDLLADLDEEFDVEAAKLDAEIAALSATFPPLANDTAHMQSRVQSLQSQLEGLKAHREALRAQYANLTQERDEQLGAADEKLKHWQDELDTVRELRQFVGELLSLNSDSDKARALQWLQSRDDLGNAGGMFQPFHDSPSSIFTSSGEPKNKVDPDGSRFTGFISCSGKERTVFYSVMAEANVTYVVEVFLRGYTLSDANTLIRRAPSLEIVADHMYTHPTLQDLRVRDITGIVRPEDALPHSKIVWTCEQAGWHVVQITAPTDGACGSFGLSIASNAPPFELVVDGREMEGAIACDTASHSTVFSFDAVEGVSYHVTAFTNNVHFTLPGSLLFVRDPEGAIEAAGSDNTQQGSDAKALSDSSVTWTAHRNGRFRVEVTSTDGTKCGTFGIRIVTLSACQHKPCPAGMVCEDHSVLGEFKCRNPYPNELSAVVSDSGVVSFGYGITATVWLDMPFTPSWETTNGAGFVNALAAISQQANPGNTIALVSVRGQAGGVGVKFAVAAMDAKDAGVVGARVLRAVLDGSLERGLAEHGVQASAWLLSFEIKDEELGMTRASVTAQLVVTGISQLAFQSPSIQIPLRVALSTAVPGVDVLGVRVVSVFVLPADSPLLASSSLLSLSSASSPRVAVTLNITTTAATSVEMAKQLRYADLATLANREFEVAGVTQRVEGVRVVETSSDRELTLKNELERCSRGDQCAGCEERMDGTGQWVEVPHNLSCVWDITTNQCQASLSSPLPCRQSPADAYLGNTQPQLLATIRLHAVAGASPPITQLIQASMRFANLSNPEHIAVLSSTQRTAHEWEVRVVVVASDRQHAVEMMRGLMAAAVEGEFERVVVARVDVGRVEVVEMRLTNARKTALAFSVPTKAAEPAQCDGVVADTEGCDITFHFTAPYRNNPLTRLPAPHGNVSVPTACKVDEASNVTFPAGRSGSVIFTDGNFADTERSVPHLIAALPSRAQPHSAITLFHSAEQWDAALRDKAWLVFPKLRGNLNAPTLPAPIQASIASFLRAGGVVVLAGTPVRGVALLNLLAGTEVEEVAPASGGLSFLAGSNVMHAVDSVRSSLSACTSSWSDQNSFTFLAPRSLPSSARVLYVAPGVDDDKVAVADVGVESGHVVYFGFDFFDAPSPDTACVLRHSLAVAMA